MINNYLDRNGVEELLQKISQTIKNHTSGEITYEEIEDLDLGQVIQGDLKNPNNFVTAKAVTDFLKKRKALKITKDVLDDDGTTFTNTTNYNGENEVEMNLKLINQRDILKLFNIYNSSTPVIDDEVDDDF